MLTLLRITMSLLTGLPAVLVCVLGQPSAASQLYQPHVDWWRVRAGGGAADCPGIAGIWLGTFPGSKDGWDHQSPSVLEGLVGVAVQHYRQYDPGGTWTGPTGMYTTDYEDPIPVGGSKTWPDIYLWAQGCSPPASEVTFGIGSDGFYPPSYRARLVLDFVPESAGWIGPDEFDFSLTYTTLVLPAATVTSPLQGTRMHITVYDTIPEPSTLALLAFGAAAIGFRSRRARRPRRL